MEKDQSLTRIPPGPFSLQKPELSLRASHIQCNSPCVTQSDLLSTGTLQRGPKHLHTCRCSWSSSSRAAMSVPHGELHSWEECLSRDLLINPTNPNLQIFPYCCPTLWIIWDFSCLQSASCVLIMCFHQRLTKADALAPVTSLFPTSKVTFQVQVWMSNSCLRSTGETSFPRHQLVCSVRLHHHKIMKKPARDFLVLSWDRCPLHWDYEQCWVRMRAPQSELFLLMLIKLSPSLE